jgi:hypothetical protein
MLFRESDAFLKDIKALGKKWRTLPGDIEEAKKVIASLYEEQEGVIMPCFARTSYPMK